MDKAENSKADFDATPATRQRNPVRRIGRMILCVLSMGMIFPNAFTEDIDLQDYEVRHKQTPEG